MAEFPGPTRSPVGVGIAPGGNCLLDIEDEDGAVRQFRRHAIGAEFRRRQTANSRRVEQPVSLAANSADRVEGVGGGGDLEHIDQRRFDVECFAFVLQTTTDDKPVDIATRLPDLDDALDLLGRRPSRVALPRPRLAKVRENSIVSLGIPPAGLADVKDLLVPRVPQCVDIPAERLGDPRIEFLFVVPRHSPFSDFKSLHAAGISSVTTPKSDV